MNIFNTKHISKSHQKGFVLPTVLVLSIVLLTLGLSVFQLTSTIARSLTDQYWQKVAKQAAQAGASYMSACVDQGLSGSTWPASITQNDTCLGVPLSSPQTSIFTNTTDTNPIPNPYRSSFTIYRPTVGTDGIPKARVVGTVSILNTAGSTTIRSYTYEMVSVINGPTNNITQVSTTQSFSFAASCITIDGKAYCWGYNANGQLGNGTTTNSSNPVPVSTSAIGDKVVTDIASGSWHTCAIAGGQVYCWGLNANGQLGDGTTTQRLTPVLINGGSLAGKTVTKIRAGSRHTCAIAGGQAHCWGLNTEGQLGDGTTTQRTTPVLINSGALAGKFVTDIDGGGLNDTATSPAYTCAVANGQAHCWGNNTYGRLGDGTTNQSLSPILINGGSLASKTVTKIRAGSNHTCAVAQGQAHCWGYNSNGQLGDGTTTQRTSPVLVNGGTLAGKFVSDIDAGPAITCSIANGLSSCWGSNTYGQIGDGTKTQRTSPVEVSNTGVLNSRVATSVNASAFHSCAIYGSQVFCWGRNQYGQLGNGTTADSTFPMRPLDFYGQ